MELPRQRLSASEGTKSTHDFLSLYNHSTVQDPIPTSQGGGCAYLKTHDFLQPLERVDKPTEKEQVSELEKPQFPAPSSSVERVLPGGTGTYSISHAPYFSREIAKPEGSIFTVVEASTSEIKNDENSSSLSGGGFTLWEESTLKKGKSGKDNAGMRLLAIAAGQWTTSEKPSQSSSDNYINSFSCLSSSKASGYKSSQSFMDMIKSAKGINTDDDLDDEEDFVLKKENSSPINKGGLRIKVDRKSSEQMADTPRSKHSATEQRRRSKINDRFQMLREIIPLSDQKRDKASFLLEVIEYIQFLQEKVQKFEGSYQGWTQEQAKMVHWKNNTRNLKSYVDHSRGTADGASPALLVAGKLEEKSVDPTCLGRPQHQRDSDVTSAITAKQVDPHSGITSKGVFASPLQPNFISPSRNNSEVSQYPPKLASNSDSSGLFTTVGTAGGDKLKQQDLNIEGGIISISSAYSQGLLHTLTQALQSSGVDLSTASVSVKIELGKRPRSTVQNTVLKDYQNPSSDPLKCSRVSRVEGSGQVSKKLKTGKS